MEETQLKKFGIVMEGGGMRGLYTAGVIDVLMENDIYADSAVGVSAGAVFGCNYKSERSEEFVVTIKNTVRTSGLQVSATGSQQVISTARSSDTTNFHGNWIFLTGELIRRIL